MKHVKLFESWLNKGNWLLEAETLSTSKGIRSTLNQMAQKVKEGAWLEVVEMLLGERDPEKCFQRCKDLLPPLEWKLKHEDMVNHKYDAYGDILNKIIDEMGEEWEKRGFKNVDYTNKPLKAADVEDSPILQAFVKAINEEDLIDKLLVPEMSDAEVRVVDYWYADDIQEMKKAVRDESGLGPGPRTLNRILLKEPTDYCIVAIDVASNVEGEEIPMKFTKKLRHRYYYLCLDLKGAQIFHRSNEEKEKFKFVAPGFDSALEKLMDEALTTHTPKKMGRRTARKFGL